MSIKCNLLITRHVAGDSDTVQFTNSAHHYVNNPAAAVLAALQAGTDMESWTEGDTPPDYYRDVIPTMLQNGTLDEALVDLALSRLLTLRFRTGLMDPDAANQPFFKIAPTDRGTAAFAADALDAGRQSMTLLLNKANALPLKPAGSTTIAVVGPYHQYGDSSSKLDAEISRLNAGGRNAVKSVQGCAVNGHDKSGFPAALAAAAAADVVVLALGTDPSLEHESMDRLEVTLPPIQSELALAVLAANALKATPAKVVVVLLNYGEISTEELAGGIDGLLMAFMPHLGTPIAEALFGAINVGGKLPYTIYPNNYTDMVAFGDMSMTSGPGRGYRYYTGTPLFQFGHGLSYTAFTLALVSPQQQQQQQRGRVAGQSSTTYTVAVTNTGPRSGAETVQLFFVPPADLGLPGWDAPVPRRRLVDWRKVGVGVGATVHVSFAVSAEQLQLVNTAGSKVQVHGTFTMLFTNGGDQTVSSPFVVG